MAFLPKVRAAVLAIPGPVVSAYLVVLMATLLVIGMIFPEFTQDFAGGLLKSGVTAGGLIAILLTGFVEVTKRRPHRLRTACDVSALPEIRTFLAAFVSRSGWDEAMAHRLDASAEETVLTLLECREEDPARARQRLLLTARKEDGRAVLEFVAAPGDGNIEDRMALLGGDSAETPAEREVSLRLLRHLASSVRHEQYHDTEFVTVRVDAPNKPSDPQT